MSIKARIFGVGSCATLILFGVLFVLTGVASAQENGPAQPATAPTENVPDEYTIGPGDVILVSIMDTPELGGKFRISDTGELQLPALSDPIHAEGQTPAQLARMIRTALIDAKQARDPRVSVFVDQFHGRTITVLGAVLKPSVYPLERRTNVLEALSMAGGLLPGAGNIVTVIRGRASAEAANTPVGSVQILNLSKVIKGEDSAANLEVRNGDVISVSSGAIVYVVGAVTKPGGFAMPDQSSGLSVVQAIAMAEGFTSVAATHRGLIVRQSSSDVARQEIPVDIAELMMGKSTDVSLAPNDILFVPDSQMKKTLKVMGDVAMAAVQGIAIYGVGYRAAGIQ